MSHCDHGAGSQSAQFLEQRCRRDDDDGDDAKGQNQLTTRGGKSMVRGTSGQMTKERKKEVRRLRVAQDGGWRGVVGEVPSLMKLEKELAWESSS